MQYEKQTFVNGQVLTAECLNRMENGIKGACDAVPPTCDSADCSKVLSYGKQGLEWVDMPEGGGSLLTVDFYGDGASHSAAVILAHVQGGGTAVLYDDGKYYALLSIVDGVATFGSLGADKEGYTYFIDLEGDGYRKEQTYGSGSADAVLYTPQALTEEEKRQARENIDAVDSVAFNQTIDKLELDIAFLGDGVVRHDMEQPLTDEQKAQARANIGAASVGEAGGSLLIVDTDFDTSSHTPEEIIAHVQSGGTAILRDDGGEYYALQYFMNGEVHFGYISERGSFHGFIIRGKDDVSYVSNGFADSIRYSPQTLSDSEKIQARQNIGAASNANLDVVGQDLEDLLDAVPVVCAEQSLTEEQKTQARANIGAAAEGEAGGGSQLVVTIDEETQQASHTSEQIHAHVQAGGLAMLNWNDVHGIPLLQVTEDCACFGYIYAEELMMAEWQIDTDGKAYYCETYSIKGDSTIHTGSITAKVGQTIVVTVVDENGKPTAWEAVDFPTDDHINSLIDAKLGVIENGSY